MSFRRHGTRLLFVPAALAATAVLSGGAAVVAIPLLAGSALKVRDNVRVRAATRVSDSAPKTPQPAEQSPTVTVVPSGTPVLTKLTELPPPDSAQTRLGLMDQWRPFIDYALAQAKQPPGSGRQSALLAPGDPLTTVRRAPCLASTPAVVIDLDEGQGVFAPEHAATIDSEVAGAIDRLRKAGMIVLWISQIPSTRAPEVAKALRASGLDPEGRDQMLLIRGPEDRKQVLRVQANADVCIVAIAGDRRGDFDELFDYLRNPAGAVALYPMMRAGWFLIPSPLGTGEPESE